MSFKKVDGLAADILDDEFINIFRPIHFVQKMIGFHRVNINYRFVTAHSIFYKLYSSTVWALNAIALIYYIALCHSIFGSVLLDTMIKRNLIVIGVLNTAIYWRNNFSYEDLNSQLYVKLQKIDRNLKHGDSVFNNKRFALFSASTTFIVTAVCISWTTFCSLFFSRTPCFPFSYAMFLAMANCLEMHLLFLILLYILIRVIYINDILQSKLSIYNTNVNEDIKKEKKKYIWSGKCNDKSESGFQELVNGVHSVLDTLADVVTLFRFPVLAFTSQAFLCNLNLVQSAVDSIKEKTTTSVLLRAAAAVTVATLMFMFFIITMTAGFLNKKLEVTRKLSFYIKFARYDGASTEHSKQLLTLLTKERCKLSIYNIFDLNYRLPLQMLALVATYTIVLLQIATL